jgi:hypothetical protein
MTKRFLLTAVLLSTIGFPMAAHAENWVELGQASTGELVSLDVDSLRLQRSVEDFRFRYQIGPDKISASVHCPTRKVAPYGYEDYIPNSGTTTDRMVTRVCQIGRQLLKQQSPKAPKAAAGLPLQVGTYRYGSAYIQIANQGDRLCYQGSTATGATTASLTPDPNMPGFYRVSGWDDTLLSQETNHSILFGSKHQLNSIEVDNGVPSEVGAVLQSCLDSREAFHQEEKSRFQRP